MKRGIVAAALMTVATFAQADWTVLDESTISYVSIKKHRIGEVNKFTGVTGSISDNGDVKVVVDLDTVDTTIPIRNERMQQLFFETVKFPEAVITAQLESVDMANMVSGKPLDKELELTINMHGFEVKKTASLRAVNSGGSLYVTTLAPIILTVKDFGFEDGLEKLKTVASLDAISAAIPVTVDLKLQSK